MQINLNSTKTLRNKKKQIKKLNILEVIPGNRDIMIFF